jgi:LysM repeat protein
LSSIRYNDYKYLKGKVIIMNDNYQIEQICPPGSFQYTIMAGDTLFILAQRFNVTVQAIINANPGIDPNRLQIGQVICIPRATPPCPNGFLYTVVAGDTLIGIAQRFNVSLQAIINANPGIDPNFIQIGQVICIPRVTPPTPPCPNGFLYTVVAGDTLFILAQRFNVTVQAIINANPGINPNFLQIGQVICIPRPMPPTPPCPNGFLYTIMAGDTLFSLAQRFNVTVQAIINANPGIDPNRLQIGQVICIPRRCFTVCL